MEPTKTKLPELFEKRKISLPPSPTPALIWAAGFGVLVTQFGVFPMCESRQIQAPCGGGGGGLGSPLAGFSPNTEISFLTRFPKLLDIWPAFLLVFSPIKTALLLILF